MKGAVVRSVAGLEDLALVKAAFIGRVAGVNVDADRDTVLTRLASVHEEIRSGLGLGSMVFATVEQVHGEAVAVVGRSHRFPVRECDALVTNERGVCLGIYVADCAAVYLVDRGGRGVGLVHSGRRGTELAIVPEAVDRLCGTCGANPGDLIASISPCIRPPNYEIDFAAEIHRQLSASGIKEIHDTGECTAREAGLWYSYRRAKGRTGRMLALLALTQ